MHKKFNHQEIEKKWQEKWNAEDLYKTKDTPDKPKAYILDMFPYPSGEGLHVGHPKGYIATDVYSRFKKMSGYEILHPMGWDAFGLPAENFALKNKIHPRLAVEKNITNFKAQLDHLGCNYDWSREINTTDPAYYKWTQWIFLKILEKGLAYESYEPINWCPSCQTGLANEDLESNGTCERCGSVVELRPMRQWVLKITDYADRLLDDLQMLPKWPEHIKEAQRNWIGRSEGVNYTQKVKDLDITIGAYDSVPQTFMAQTFAVIAPEHPLVAKLVAGTPQEKEVLDFVKDFSSKKSRAGFEIEKTMEGIFTGRYVEDPFGTGDLPIWIASFVVADYGTGFVNCSAHDERDFAFAKKYGIPLRPVMFPEDPVEAEKVRNLEYCYHHAESGILASPVEFVGRKWGEVRNDVIDYIEKKGFGGRAVQYKLRDWVFSRQRYWGEPIPIIHCEKDGIVSVPYDQLPVKLPEVEHYEPTGTGESPLAAIDEWVNVTCPKCGGLGKRETNTMPQWAGSSWYYLRFIDPHNDLALIDSEKEKKWMPVDVYVGGDHAVRHLIYARFWHKFLYDIGIVHTIEPFSRLEFLGFILAPDGRKMSKRWGNVINPDDIVKKNGADTLRVYEMFMGPFENTIAWDTNNLAGAQRFVERANGLREHVREKELLDITKLLHHTIDKVTRDIENFKFNTAISAMMILLNAAEKEGLTAESYKSFLRLLAPFAPHLAEELWEKSGEVFSIHRAAWPVADPSLLVKETVTIAVQIDGRVRATIAVAINADEKLVKETAMKEKHIVERLKEVEIIKVVYVPEKVLNFIITNERH